MNPLAQIIVTAVVGFLVGSIPTAYIAGRLRGGIDLRDHGSGNVGTTNAFRVLGPFAAVLVLLVDVGKGILAVAVGDLPFLQIAEVTDATPLIGGVAAILGHSFSPWVGFQGGKGVATAAGVFLALAPWAAVPAAAVWGLMLMTTRIMSIASLAGAAVLPTTLIVHELGRIGEGDTPWATMACSVLVALLVFLRHRGNIKRLREGTEKGLW